MVKAWGQNCLREAEPEVLNYAWRDYGNRVGVWRLLELLDPLRLPVALLMNASIYDYGPEVVGAVRDRNDEMVAHGRTNAERQSVLSTTEETALIQETTELEALFLTAKKTWETPDAISPIMERQTQNLVNYASYSRVA